MGKKMVNKAVYLTICEFYFLLIQQNIQGLILFEEIAKYVPEQRELAEGALSLMRKGVLIPCGDSCYHLSDEMKTVMNILNDARSTYVVNGQLLSCPMQCFYFMKDLCLILQMDDFREGMIRIEVSERQSAVDGLLDYEFMPDAAIFQLESEEELEDCGMEQEMISAAIEKLLSDESVMLVVDRYVRNSVEPDSMTVVYSREEKYFMTVAARKEVHTALFKTELLYNLFLEG